MRTEILDRLEDETGGRATGVVHETLGEQPAARPGGQPGPGPVARRRGWVAGRRGWVAGRRGWVAGRRGWVAGPRRRASPG